MTVGGIKGIELYKTFYNHIHMYTTQLFTKCLLLLSLMLMTRRHTASGTGQHQQETKERARRPMLGLGLT